jgi:hypothetical protein
MFQISRAEYSQYSSIIKNNQDFDFDDILDLSEFLLKNKNAENYNDLVKSPEISGIKF